MARDKKNPPKRGARGSAAQTPGKITQPKSGPEPETKPETETETGPEPELPARLPSETSPTWSVVGIGASAGGLAAFEAFFAGMPAEGDPNIALVLVQHLAPDHKSLLTGLVRKYTKMQVFEVEDGMQVQPQCVYVIPPNTDMLLHRGVLQLLEPNAPHGKRMVIDQFFRSLAADQRERAVGIILSGTGADGTLGVRAIKGHGGMVMAQSLDATEFDGMPRSAIATGLVDFQLPPAEMGAELVRYVAHPLGRPSAEAPSATSRTNQSMNKIFALLSAGTGHDFSEYKANTIHRRIERRLAVHQIDSIDSYVQYLRLHAAEVTALYRDLLIGVTSFFRDPETFEALRDQVLPGLFADKLPDAVIRVWSVGCSTGEEAYSLAILLAEQQDARKQRLRVQIFATDIDDHAIEKARRGVYPASIAADVTPERLSRFFTSEAGGDTYRVRKNLRDMLIFSEQDVLRDPPFSRLDLLVCRNLLIYMDAGLQQRLIPLFHYALNPQGRLFLGTSETVSDFSDLFSTVDRKAKLYQSKSDFPTLRKTPLAHMLRRPVSPEHRPTPKTGKPASAGRSLRELTEQTLLAQVAPAAALVNDRGDILFLHGRTGSFLEPAPGEAGVSNVIQMAREGLQRDLTTALHKVAAGHGAVCCPNLRTKTNGGYTQVDLSVVAVAPELAGHLGSEVYLVIFDKARGVEATENPSRDHAEGSSAEVTTPEGLRIAELTRQLKAKEEYLQTTTEELETSNEELKAANEELQSINEELQSTNEELETSKEELQSVNEELTTVNAELQSKVGDLSHANNDMNNLLAGTGVATVFVDRALHILRFTPAATHLINLIPGDIGRPVGHIVSNLVGYDTLVADAQTVLQTFVPVEREVQSTSGSWYSMRIQPYRTLEHSIEGVVLTFVDITDSIRAHEALRLSEARLALAVKSASAGLWEWDLATDEYSWSHELWFLYGLDPQMATPSRARWMESVLPEDRERVLETIRTARANNAELEVAWRVRTADGTLRSLMSRGQPQLDAQGQATRYLGIAMDISDGKRTQQALRLAQLSLDHALEPILWIGSDGGLRYANDAASELLGYSRAELLKLRVSDVSESLPGQPFMNHWDELSRRKQLVLSSTWRTQDGRELPVVVTSHHLDVEGSGIECVYVQTAGAGTQMYKDVGAENPTK